MSYEVIDGEHRLRAAKLLGWKKIRCIIREVDEDRAQEINYAKNKLRGHINPWKEAELFNQAWKKLVTQDAVAKKFGVSQPYVADAMSLMRVSDEVKQIIARAIIQPSSRVLRILASLEDPTDQEALAKEIAEGITVRDAAFFVQDLKTPKVKPLGDVILPCSTCSNDIACGRVHFRVDNAGNYICEYQNRPLEIPPKPPETPTTMPTTVPTTIPVPIVKKGPYWCPWCKHDRETHQVKDRFDGKVKVCGFCGREVEAVKTEKEGESEEASAKTTKEKTVISTDVAPTSPPPTPTKEDAALEAAQRHYSRNVVDAVWAFSTICPRLSLLKALTGILWANTGEAAHKDLLGAAEDSVQRGLA